MTTSGGELTDRVAGEIHRLRKGHGLQAGDLDTARFVGIPIKLFLEQPPGPPDAATRAILEPMIEAAALTQAIDEAWALCAILTVAALLCVPFARRVTATPR